MIAVCEICEIEGCGRRAVGTTSGVVVCDRCRVGYVSVGLGAVYFGARWHGAVGASYTTEQLSAFPGVGLARGARP